MTLKPGLGVTQGYRK